MIKIQNFICFFLCYRQGCRVCSRTLMHNTGMCMKLWKRSSGQKGCSDHWGASTSLWWERGRPMRSTSPAMNGWSTHWATSFREVATAILLMVRAFISPHKSLEHLISCSDSRLSSVSWKSVVSIIHKQFTVGRTTAWEIPSRICCLLFFPSRGKLC